MVPVSKGPWAKAFIDPSILTYLPQPNSSVFTILLFSSCTIILSLNIFKRLKFRNKQKTTLQNITHTLVDNHLNLLRVGKYIYICQPYYSLFAIQCSIFLDLNFLVCHSIKNQVIPWFQDSLLHKFNYLWRPEFLVLKKYWKYISGSMISSNISDLSSFFRLINGLRLMYEKA